MSDTFDHIVSLGSDCDVAMQLRRIGWLHTPSVFDWLVTPWDAMMGVLTDNGEQLACSVEIVKDGTAAACRAYGLLYWHEFRRDEHGRVDVSEPALLLARQKLRHKMARLRAVLDSDRRVLFVRAGVSTDAPGDRFGNDGIFRMRELDRCASTLSDLYPRLRFCLLLIDYKGRDRLDDETARDPRILRATIELPPDSRAGENKNLPDTVWNGLLSSIPYRPRARHLPCDEVLPA